MGVPYYVLLSRSEPQLLLLLLRNGSNTGNGGITTLPSFPELPVFPGGGTAANTRWPV